MHNSTISIIASIVLSILLIPSVTAISVERVGQISHCLDFFNVSCENCVAVEIEIISQESSEDLYVGDAFRYNISFIGINNDVGKENYWVYVFNPDGEQLGVKYYGERSIERGNLTTLYPFKPDRITEYDIYSFELPGTYRIIINATNENFSSDNSFKFYRVIDAFPNCYYNWYYGTYIFYFDVMPKWEHRRNELANEQNIINKDYNKRIEILQSSTESLTKRIEGLTGSLIILTFIMIIIQLWKGIKKWRKILLGLEGLIIFIYTTYYLIITLFSGNNIIWGFFLLFITSICILIPSVKLLKGKKNPELFIFFLFISSIITNIIWGLGLFSSLHSEPIYNTVGLFIVAVCLVAALQVYYEDLSKE